MNIIQKFPLVKNSPNYINHSLYKIRFTSPLKTQIQIDALLILFQQALSSGLQKAEGNGTKETVRMYKKVSIFTYLAIFTLELAWKCSNFQICPLSAIQSCDGVAEASAHSAGTDLQPHQTSQIHTLLTVPYANADLVKPIKEHGHAIQHVPAHDIADHVGMADKDLIAVFFLLHISSMNEVSKSSLNSSSIFVILLMAQSSELNTAQSSVCHSLHLQMGCSL